MNLIRDGLSVAVTVFTIGCTAAVSSNDAGPLAEPEVAAPAQVDAAAPAPDAGVDRSSPPDAGAFDLPAESQTDAGSEAPADTSAVDGPRPWPPPGTDYLTKLASEADYNQLAGTSTGGGVAFIIRRRANDQAYPYPWDRYECVFETGYLHVEFLQRMDASRAVGLYFGDAKSEAGSLIPGRLKLDQTRSPNVMKVTIENFQGGFMGPPAYFPLDATVVRLLRERI
ncbi:MAG TPA: hypothetical protein VFH73_26870, partial [Polyangia bacterium]|nr:hypothetical protein [Polyangia bacterium]